MGRRAATIPERSAALKHQCRAIAPGSPMTIGVVQYSGCSRKGLAKYYRYARSPAFPDLMDRIVVASWNELPFVRWVQTDLRQILCVQREARSMKLLRYGP